MTLFLDKVKMIISKQNLIKATLFIIALTVIFYLLNQILYPQRVCSGEVTQKLVWTDNTTNERKILIDEKKPLLISFVFKRGAIYLNDDRFPLYKELSGVDNFAQKTESGYSGQYSQQGLLGQESNFTFRFNELTSMLFTENQAKGMHIYENKDGSDSLKIEFAGNCSRKFL